MPEPYTDATVLRIADGLTEYPAGACDCGECRQRIVRAVLDALTAAGLLIRTPPEPVTEEPPHAV